jgi:hypothetical protein
MLFPELATYMLRHRLQYDDAEEEANVRRMWRDVYKIVETAAAVTGMAAIVLNPGVVKQIEGDKHFIFSKCLLSVASNTLLLACHYGLVAVHEDEVSALQGRTVTTKRGRSINCDVLIKCMGFGTDESLLDGHVVKDSYFIDGVANMTHNLRADTVNGSGLIGPNVRCSNFLIR